MAGSDVRVITEDRRKLALGCVVMSAACTLLALSRNSDPMLRVGIVFLGFLGAMGVVRLVRPFRLVLDDRGLTFRGTFVTSNRRWADVERIEIKQRRSRRWIKLVGPPGVSADLTLAGAWPISTDELAALLDDRLNQFGRRGSV